MPLFADPSLLSGNRMDVSLQATLTESLSISFPNAVASFGSITAGSNTPVATAQPILISSSWVLTAGRTVKLYAYFDSASSAMSGNVNGDLIPTSALSASLNGGATQSFTQTSPFTSGPTALLLYSIPITLGNAILNGRSDSLSVLLNVGGLALHADTYNGTMHVQAQAL